MTPTDRPIDDLEIAAALEVAADYGGGTHALARVARDLGRFAAEVERLRAFVGVLAERLAAASESLSRAAERRGGVAGRQDDAALLLRCVTRLVKFIELGAPAKYVRTEVDIISRVVGVPTAPPDDDPADEWEAYTHGNHLAAPPPEPHPCRP